MINNISGLILLDKPKGISSNKALILAKKKFGAAKAGHCGTLDPLASGLLPICLGEATKFSNLWLDADKEYIATMCLGKVTTTYDSEGDVVENNTVPELDLDALMAYLDKFVGEIEQTPPIYSALKHNGKPMYEYARAGIDIDMSIKKRLINIKQIELLEYNAPFAKIRVLCSKGTYIRSLVYDIGYSIGCGAYMSDLIRSETLGLKISQAIKLDDLLVAEPDQIKSHLHPIDLLVQHIIVLTLLPNQIQDLHFGRVITISDLDDGEYSIRDDTGIFHGLVTSSEGVIKVKRFMSM